MTDEQRLAEIERRLNDLLRMIAEVDRKLTMVIERTHATRSSASQ